MTKNKEKIDQPAMSTEELQESIEALEQRIVTVNSKRMVFLRGVISGLGRAVGATIIFAVVLGGFSALLYNLGWFPEFNDFIVRFLPGSESPGIILE